MSRNSYQATSLDAAAAVAGTTSSATIEVLAASGTTWQGSVTLWVSVVGQSTPLTQCFSYVFAHTVQDAIPHRVNPCPSGSGIDHTTLHTPPLVTAQTRAAVVRAMSSVGPAHRTDTASVRSALRGGLPADFFIDAGPQDAGVFAWVRSAGQCLTVQTSSQAVLVSQPRQGLACNGG